MIIVQGNVVESLLPFLILAGPVSATSVATPGSTFTSTSQGGVDIARGTTGRKLLGSMPQGGDSG